MFPQATSVLQSSPLFEHQDCYSNSKQSSQNSSDVISIDSEESSLDSLPSVSGISVKKKIPPTSTFKNRDSVSKGNNSGKDPVSLSLFERLKKSHSSSKKTLESGTSSSIDSQDTCSQKSIKSISSESSSVQGSEPTFVLRPGQFEIVLCVDNAEFYGG